MSKPSLKRVRGFMGNPSLTRIFSDPDFPGNPSLTRIFPDFPLNPRSRKREFLLVRSRQWHFVATQQSCTMLAACHG